MPQRQALRWVAGLVLLCVFVQALLMPGQRIDERTHFHVSSDATPAVPARPSLAQAVFAHRKSTPAEAAPHRHAGLQDHDHDHGEQADVVYVDAPDDHQAQQTSVKRILLDHDGPWASLLPAVVIHVARIAYVKSTLLLSSRNEPPLERPPRG